MDVNPSGTADESYADSIVLGGMFFEEFYGAFTNTYQTSSTSVQTAELYVGVNSIYPAYIGDESLPLGVNPFPQPPAP